MYGGPLAMGSGLLPTDTVRCVVGYCIPFFHVRKNNPSILDPVDHSPSISLSFPLKPKSTPSVLEPQLLYSSFSISTSLGLVIMASSNDSLVNEMIAETENCCLEDFSIQVAPDLESAQETIAKTVVGRLYSKKMISHGTLRKTLSGIPQEVKFVLENGPWNPCGGFLLVTSLPEDGRWESADLLKLDIWVKAKGVPLPYLTEDCLAQMAKRMGLLLSANKVRRNGIVVNDFLRFQVRLDLSRPLLAGVSLPEINQKKIWSYFKYERLPIFCYKCGVIGHLEDDCSGLKRMVTAHNGRSLPLYGSWLKDGSRLENGFALLEVEEIQDIQRLEKEDISTGGNGPSAAPPAAQLGGVAIQFPEKSTGDRGNPGCAEVADVPAGRTRVEQVGMEGVVSQKGDNEFNVAYNDYVDMTHFPSKHVIHVANLFKDKLGPIKFGAAREEVDQTGPKSGLVQKLKKPKLIGPRGIPKPSIFGRRPNNMGHSSGAKRKKLLNDVVNVDPFVAESDGLSCLVGVDKTGIKDAFAEESGVNHLANSNSSDVSVDPNKKSRLLINSLRSNEGSFGFIQEQKDGINGSAPTDETKMANLPPGHKSGTIQVSEQRRGPLPLGFDDCHGGVDLGCTGNFFTWSNGRSLPALVKERLDRAICDPDWIILYPKAGVKSLAIKDSDHAAVLLDLLFDRERFKTPFRYLDAWSRDESCKDVIREAWAISVHGIRSFQLVSKLDNTRRRLSIWNRTHFGLCKEKLKTLNRLLLEYWEGGIKSFWNHDSPKSLSFGARSILASRDLIRKESCFLIANGRATNLRHAPWIPWLDWDQFRAAFNPMITPISTHVSSLLNEEREWDYLQAATWMVPSVASSLHLISLLPIHHEDRLIWKDATNGEFSPRVAYKSIIKGRLGEKDLFWGRIWKLKISERMKLFLWKLGRDILPFGERLQRIFGNDVVCAVCEEH
ncbi:hypothetical protein F8388_019326 [Cannabis sativa]|uniref:CCHC-type domain-containing protein n=1 Tax=Cannabis sativa TaxID=3483 RepID=A0A7J6FQY8_CANSA|nr:hypothetical protein F8388_019326 [Cannabis sativa]